MNRDVDELMNERNGSSVRMNVFFETCCLMVDGDDSLLSFAPEQQGARRRTDELLFSYFFLANLSVLRVEASPHPLSGCHFSPLNESFFLLNYYFFNSLVALDKL